MNTEITDTKKFHGWVLYDGDCRYCVELAGFLHPILMRRDFKLAPLQAPWVRARLGLADSELLAEMRLLEPSGKIIGGADAWLEIARYFWWTWPVRQMARIPAAMNLFRSIYRWIARHRYCLGGTCSVGNRLSQACQCENGGSGGNVKKVKRRTGKRSAFFEMP